MNKSVKLMLIEDQKLIRTGIRTIFEESEGYTVVAEASNGREAVEKFKIKNPDIVLLDLILPDISGITLIKQLSELNDNVKIAVLTAYDGEDEILKALSLGVYGYIFKDIHSEILISVVKTIADGAIWLDPHIVPVLREKNNGLLPEKKVSRAVFRNSHSNLTRREFEVLKLIVDGKSNNAIADELCISEHTAKAHVCNIIQKLVVDDRTQAAVKAIKEGIV